MKNNSQGIIFVMISCQRVRNDKKRDGYVLPMHKASHLFRLLDVDKDGFLSPADITAALAGNHGKAGDFHDEEVVEESAQAILQHQRKPMKAPSRPEPCRNWSLAAKLPNSDVNFTVNAPKNPQTQKRTQNSPSTFVRQNSPQISAEAFS